MKILWIIHVFLLTYLTLTWSLQSQTNKNSCHVTTSACSYHVTISDVQIDRCNGGGGSAQNVEITEVKKRKQKHKRHRRKNQARLLQTLDKLFKKMHDIERQLQDTVFIASLCHEATLSQGKNATAERCPQGFISLDYWNSCYLLSKFNASWYEAQHFCSAFQSHLISMATTQEHYLLTFVIGNNKDYNTAEGWWTSGTFIAKTRQWVWASELFVEPFAFVKWTSNEPNEQSGQCMVIKHDDEYLWHDEPCNEKYNFICEKEIKK